jgi:CBS domain-containing protein
MNLDEEMMIKSCMKKNVVSIKTTATLKEAARKMSQHHIGLLPVVEKNNRIVGMIACLTFFRLNYQHF